MDFYFQNQMRQIYFHTPPLPVSSNHLGDARPQICAIILTNVNDYQVMFVVNNEPVKVHHQVVHTMHCVPDTLAEYRPGVLFPLVRFCGCSLERGSAQDPPLRTLTGAQKVLEQR